MPQSKFTAEFERAMLPHLDSAYNLARWLLRNDEDAQDVVHDAFLRAHRYFSSFNGTDARAWLFGIVRNTCFNVLRARKAQSAAPAESNEVQVSADVTPESQVILDEDLRALRNCIEALPPEYREVVILRELEEFSYKEISTTAGIALGTVMSRLNRARIRLENCLSAKGREAGQ